MKINIDNLKKNVNIYYVGADSDEDKEEWVNEKLKELNVFELDLI